MKASAMKKIKIESVHQRLGERVRDRRRRLGFTQEDLAFAIGHERSSVANMETGRHRFLLHVIEDLAVALSTSPRQLLKGIWT
jgi:transcriptional regulator with XRE-family HTH domain